MSSRSRSAAAVCLAGLLGVVGLAAPMLGAGAPQPARTVVNPQDLRASALSFLSLTNGQVVNLSVDRTPERAMKVSVPINGQLVTLDLFPNSVRAKGYQAFEQIAGGEIIPAKPAPENTLWGTVSELPGSTVAGGIMPEGLYARVQLADGTDFWIESIEGRVQGAQPGDHVVYSANDIVNTGNFECGGTPLGQQSIPPFVPDRFQPRGTATNFTATLGADADWEFYQQYGSTSLVQSRIQLVFNTMNLQYSRDVNIRHNIGTILVRTDPATQPYTSLDINTLLNQFRTEWNTNQGGITRNVAQLFTGKNITAAGSGGGIVIGLGFVGVVCTSNAYSWVRSNFNNNFASATDLSAHELGHNWNSCHCTCDSGTPGTRFTMNPFITSINKFGTVTDECSTNSVASIVAYRNSKFPSCLGSGSDPAPLNDDCGNARTLSSSGTVAFSTTAATTDGPAGTSCRPLSSNDIWYTYTAPCDGTFTVNTCNSGFDTVLAAYTGFCGSLTEVSCNDDTGPGAGCDNSLQSSIQVAVTRGTTYYVRLLGYQGATGTGFISTSQSFCPAPSNDSCGSAITVANGFPVAFSTIGATTDGPTEPGLCNNASNVQVAQDVWFRYTPPCTGSVRVSTCGSDFDSRIAIYTGCPSGPGQAVACNDDNGTACTGTRASLDFNGTAGVTYTIRVGGYAANVGSGTLTVTSLSCPRPANDDCAAATVVPSVGGTYVQTFLGSTNDGSSGCGGIGGDNTARDIWFSYTPTCDTVLTVNTCATNNTGGVDAGIDTVVSVHAGCPGNSSNQLVCNDDATSCGSLDTGLPRDSAVTVNASGGVNYIIRVASFGTSTPPNQNVTVTILSAPANDTCANAQVIGDGTTGWCNVNATQDGPSTNTPCTFVGRSDVWFRYTATGSGITSIDTCGTAFDTVISVYDTASCSPLGPVLSCNDDFGPVCPSSSAASCQINTAATQTYLIRVGGFSSGAAGQGTGTLNITPPAVGVCCRGVTCTTDLSAAGCTNTVSNGVTIVARYNAVGNACNGGGVLTQPCCYGNFDGSGDGVQVADIFAFLSAFFANSPYAVIQSTSGGADPVGAPGVPDIFNFLSSWFGAGGCV